MLRTYPAVDCRNEKGLFVFPVVFPEASRPCGKVQRQELGRERQ